MSGVMELNLSDVPFPPIGSQPNGYANDWLLKYSITALLKQKLLNIIERKSISQYGVGFRNEAT
jgi:hypothetical protein